MASSRLLAELYNGRNAMQILSSACSICLPYGRFIRGIHQSTSKDRRESRNGLASHKSWTLQSHRGMRTDSTFRKSSKSRVGGGMNTASLKTPQYLRIGRNHVAFRNSSGSQRENRIERTEQYSHPIIEDNVSSLNINSTKPSLLQKDKSLTSRWEGSTLTEEQMEVAKHFHNLGLHADLCRQLATSQKNIRKPTLNQALYLKAIRKQSDIILRASSGSGKSFAALLSAFNKNPNLFDQFQNQERKTNIRNIETIILVPTRELALQYKIWAQSLVPKSLHEKMNEIVNVGFYTKTITAEEHLKKLYKETPSVLIVTAKLLWHLLQEKDADKFLIRNLKMLLLDEVDEMLDLPGKFPTKKAIWRHSKHPPPALEVLRKIMTLRTTHSSGEIIPMSGLEDEKQMNRIPQDVRDRALTAAKTLERQARTANLNEEESNRGGGPVLPKFSTSPLQLVVMSATANAVLRHFLGARTGWLRTGIRDPITKVELGKWIDTTGLSSGVKKADEMQDIRVLPMGVSVPVQVPKEINHFSVVVDDVPQSASINEQEEKRTDPSIAWRNLKNQTANEISEFRRTAKTTERPEMKDSMLTCLAFLFASQGVRKGLVVIPDTWSIFKVLTFLREIGVPAHDFFEFESSQSEPNGKVLTDQEDEFLFVTSKSTIRGLDIMGGLSHVFIVGIDAIGDAATYTHIAGRVSRLGNDVESQDELHQRPTGTVITLLRGLSEEDCLKDGRYNSKTLLKREKIGQADQESSPSPPAPKLQYHYSQEEVKMASILKQLSLPLQKISPLRAKI